MFRVFRRSRPSGPGRRLSRPAVWQHPCWIARIVASRALQPAAPAQLLELFAKLLELFGRQRPIVGRHLGPDPRSGDDRGIGAAKELAAHGDLEGGASPAPGRVDVADLRRVDLCLRGRRQQERHCDQNDIASRREHRHRARYMISLRRPAILTPSAASGVTWTFSPCGLGNRPSGSIPIFSYMLPIRSHG